jgi:hypothetical protein
MTLCFIDGFETNDYITKYDEYQNVAYITGRNGQGLYVQNGGSDRLRKRLKPADEHATLIVGRAFRSSTGTVGDPSAWVSGGAFWGNGMCFMSDEGVTPHISINLAGNNGTIQVTRGLQNGTVLGSWAWPSPSYSDWIYLEAKVVLHDSAGSVEVKMNGTTVINLTGIDTKNGGTKTVFDSVGIGAPQTENGVHNLIDDLYICNGAGSVNNDFLGDVAVETRYPNGNGSSSQFVGSDGNSTDNYLLVDEANAPNLADYVEATTSGYKDLYAIQDLVRTSGPILGVQVTDHVKNSDSGAVSARTRIKSGATEAAGDTVAMTTTWKTMRDVWELNPDGSVAWNIAAVNALEAGVEVV